MSFNKLDPEIWLHILDFLRPPIPKPLSGLTKQEAINEPIEIYERLPDSEAFGVISRADIRSDALAKLMRTSIMADAIKAFNHLSTIPLYWRIITDDYPALIRNSNHRSAHPSLANKAELLSHTRKLSLEYKSKGVFGGRVHPERSYSEILRDAGSSSSLWGHVGRSAEQMAFLRLGAELDHIYDQAQLFRRHPSACTLFPSLTHLTTGMIFGGQGGLWEEGAKGGWKTKMAVCQASLVATFRGSPITHFCQRGFAGPLSLPYPAFSWGSTNSTTSSINKPLFTIHYNISPGSNKMPIAIGNPTRWLMEPSSPGEHFDVVIATVGNAVGIVLHAIEEPRSAHEARNYPHSHLDLQIHGSTTGLPSPIPVSTPAARNPALYFGEGVDNEAQLGTIRDLNKNWGKRKEQQGAEVDNFNWAPSNESPPCEACGWVYE